MFFKQASGIVKIFSVCLVDKHKKKTPSQKNEIKEFNFSIATGAQIEDSPKIGRKNSTSQLQLGRKSKEN